MGKMLDSPGIEQHFQKCLRHLVLFVLPHKQENVDLLYPNSDFQENDLVNETVSALFQFS